VSRDGVILSDGSPLLRTGVEEPLLLAGFFNRCC